MKEFLSGIRDDIAFHLFKGRIFKQYHDMYDKGAYKEAYSVLRDIVNKHPKWSKKGDPYVTFAKLEFLANQDDDAALKQLEKAKELGCSHESAYYAVLGQVYWRKRDIEKSIKSFEKSIELEPSISNLRTFGDMLSYEHDKHAVEIWERIIKKDPNNPVALAYLGIEAERAGDYEEAKKYAEKADNFATCKEDFFNIGLMHFRECQYQKALKYYHKCEELNFKTKSRLFEEMSMCYTMLEDFSSATLYAIKAFNVHPNDELSKIRLLGCIEKHFDSSLINSIVDKYPDTAFSYIILAWQAYLNSDFSKVEQLLAKTIELKPSMEEMFRVARIFHFIKNYEKAITFYLKSQLLGYEYPGYLYSEIANCYFALQDHESAIKFSVKALELDFSDNATKDSLLYYAIQNEADTDLGKLLDKYPDTSFANIINSNKAKKMLNISAAHEYAEKALQENPSPIEKYYIGWLYMDLENHGKALAIFNELEESGFEDKSRLYHSFSCCYFDLAEYKSAINYAEKALDINPDNEDAKEIMYDSKKEMGDFGDNY